MNQLHDAGYSEIKSPDPLALYLLRTRHLYDVGYSEIKSPDLLAGAVNALGATLVDIRFSPRSRVPYWNGPHLARLVAHYVHLGALGNRNYKGGSVEYVDLPAGLTRLAVLLFDRPAVLLCACSERSHCHRLGVVQAFAQGYGVESTPLTLSLCQRLTGSDTQLPLFPEP